MNLYSLSFIIFSVILAGASDEKTPKPKIIGGHEAKKHSHPYIVSLQMKFLWVRTHICGGSILKEEWVLTAAHCVQRSWFIRWLLPIEAIAGAHDVNNFGPDVQITGIKETIAHPLYEGGIGPYDIAVLQTQNTFSFSKAIQPIGLPIPNYRIDKADPLILAGWGALRTTIIIPDVPSRLQEVQVKYMTHDECYEAIEQLLEDEETNPLDEEAHMCTGPITGGKAACSGDSGGPLIQKIITNRIIREDTNITRIVEERQENMEIERVETPVVVGLVAWGFAPCGMEGSPTVYTKVSEYLGFIEYSINSNKK